ncbi:MAG TPA: lipoyl synthase [Syntrophales bacterium]|nr:lipoyl synthase [Syntrophales bacterium]
MQIKRKPEWLKVRLPASHEFNHVRGVLSQFNLHSICQEARCPNVTECFHSGTATFLILGNVCTRKCLYCNVKHGLPEGLDDTEPERLTRAVKELGLKYAVITSVTRDDLQDGGAEIFARCIAMLRREVPECRVEVLIPDLRGNWDALASIIKERPDVINHNVECVPSFFSFIRPQGDYRLSLEILRRIHQHDSNGIVIKSGFMVGFGEFWSDIMALLQDLAHIPCGSVTIGQYQQPTRDHWPVMKYYHPDEFEVMKGMALEMGLANVEAGPLVRSSYHAAATFGNG